MEQFLLSCESTVDLPYSYMEKRNIPVLFYSYQIEGTEYVDDMLRDPMALPRFYGFLEEGKMPHTSQINEFSYYDFFSELVKTHDKIFHIVLGSGMTTSIVNAEAAAKKVSDESGKTIVVLDSYCSSSGYGLLVDMAADMRDNGDSLEQVVEKTTELSKKIHHQFFSTTLKWFKKSGRVSGATAMIATVLGICPIMHLDNAGKIVAYSKARGKRAAIEKTVSEMVKHAENGNRYNGKVFLSHSNCLSTAYETKNEILKNFPNLKSDDIKIFDIGTIIASHSGPGTVAVYFVGDVRE